MTDVLIEFKNFGFQYTAQAAPTLYGINLTVRRGEKLLIAGPSGCGKSTLASCINGLIPFSFTGEMTGSLTVKGKETKDMSIFELSKIIGTVLQDSDVQFVGMTVAEDIAFALENDCMPVPELKEKVAQVAGTVDIASHLSHSPTELSGGQKQRVAIGGVMVDDVEVFLYDEPLANLDPATGKQAMELLDEIAGRTGAAVIIIEHRIEDVLHIDVDRVILMQDGRIVSDSSAQKLLSGTLLNEAGVREPLYVTALKYAGVSVSEKMHPENIKKLMLSDGQTGDVKKWFHETVEKEPAPEEDVLINVSDLEFTYDNGFKALNNINLEIRKGELLAIVGKNGAGKSTFSKVICGFEIQQRGEIFFDGLDMNTLSIKERADRIGFCMQNPNQMICKTMIFDEVALGLRTRGVGEDEIKERVYDALKVCGLYPFRNWPVSALSFGQKKRVTIASILALNPQMIILDEPTAGQDFRHYTEIMEFLRSLNKRGLTIIMITHDMHLMLEYAKRTVVFCDGRVIADGTSAQVLADAAVVKKANLKETSLYELARLCGIDEGEEFVQHFIDYDRTVRQEREEADQAASRG